MQEKNAGALFVVAQVVLLVALALLPGGGDWPTPLWLRWTGLAIGSGGILLVLVAASKLGSTFTPTPVPLERGELATTGLYGLVRHPIYSGVLLAVLGLTLPSGSWTTLTVALLTFGFFCWKASWEEARLRAKFPGYGEYADRTPRFVPGLRRSGRGPGQS